jgi:hypothetical protein
MPKPTWNEIDGRVRRLIADDKGYHPEEIHDNDRLREDLRYDDDGLEALGPDINREFFTQDKGLSTTALLNCLKVIGIVARIDEQPVADFR